MFSTCAVVICWPAHHVDEGVEGAASRARPSLVAQTGNSLDNQSQHPCVRTARRSSIVIWPAARVRTAWAIFVCAELVSWSECVQIVITVFGTCKYSRTATKCRTQVLQEPPPPPARTPSMDPSSGLWGRRQLSSSAVWTLPFVALLSFYFNVCVCVCILLMKLLVLWDRRCCWYSSSKEYECYFRCPKYSFDW